MIRRLSTSLPTILLLTVASICGAQPLPNAQLSASWLWCPADPSTDDTYFQEFAAQGQSPPLLRMRLAL
jgi:hypothetical protein